MRALKAQNSVAPLRFMTSIACSHNHGIVLPELDVRHLPCPFKIERIFLTSQLSCTGQVAPASVI
jgi:hypothetical protein